MDPDFDPPPPPKPSGVTPELGGVVASALVFFLAAFLWVGMGMPTPSMPDIQFRWIAAGAVWLGLAGLTSWLADQRGYPPRKWFVLGVLFGVFALITVGLAPVRPGAGD